ncbi:MAG: hypothetical protein U0L26_00475 [Cellulosilyticum sp.]|nr:hypothetical protein [Cellulosilyticum sp.]
MNYGKLQLSFILLLAMTTILMLTCLLVVHKPILALTSFIAMLLSITGIIFTLKAEGISKNKHENKD